MLKIWILLLFFSPFILLSQTTHQEWFQIEDSEINILGTSNVTDYQCVLHDLENNSDLQIKSTTKDLLITLENAVIKLKSNGFNCNSSPMTKDFLKTIQAEEHPHIYIEFLSFQLNHSVTEKRLQKNVIARIAVTLAGVRKVYSLKLDSLEFKMDSITTKGKKEIKMSDFDIEAPSALFGLVKADDLVTIDFRIVFNLK
ncbi:YceI family protein [Owenweeksia hongkongensis]|uniref:YceI family protein n=1 Tax=Owenweeksia hongkongensis TaxID=253245 RepID=UPI003A8E76ED